MSKKKLLEFLGKRKKEDYIVLALVGALLLLLVLPTEKKESTPQDKSAVQGEEDRAASRGDVWEEGYGEYWESRLEEFLSRMDGVGNVRVVMSLEDSGERVVEKDIPVTRSTTNETDSNGGTREINNFSSEEQTLLVTEESGRQMPYVVRETTPKVTGILVLAEGGDDPEIKEQITRLLEALFGVDAHKIVVVKMKTG